MGLLALLALAHAANLVRTARSGRAASTWPADVAPPPIMPMPRDNTAVAMPELVPPVPLAQPAVSVQEPRSATGAAAGKWLCKIGNWCTEKPAVSVQEPEPAVPIPEPKPAAPIPEPKPAVPIPEPKPAVPIPEPEPAAPIPEPKPAAPVPAPVPVRVAPVEPPAVEPREFRPGDAVTLVKPVRVQGQGVVLAIGDPAKVVERTRAREGETEPRFLLEAADGYRYRTPQSYFVLKPATPPVVAPPVVAPPVVAPPVVAPPVAPRPVGACHPAPRDYKIEACALVKEFAPLELGDKGRSVQCLQKVLNAQGYCGYACLAEGEYDRVTRAKLHAFQKIQKLPKSDKVDDELWCKILAFADQPARFPTQIKAGAKGDDVIRLQYVLTEKGYPVEVTGTFDRATAKQVTQFQRDHALHTDCVVGPSTWGTLLDMAIDGTAPKTLKEGAKGQHVKRLQELLTEEGFAVEASGTFDAATTRQVRAFQKKLWMKVDGIVGRGTWGKLLDEVFVAP